MSRRLYLRANQREISPGPTSNREAETDGSRNWGFKLSRSQRQLMDITTMAMSLFSAMFGGGGGTNARGMVNTSRQGSTGEMAKRKKESSFLFRLVFHF